MAAKGHQPAGWIAAVKQQNIIWSQARQCLHQHRPFGGVCAVNTGVQRQLGVGQVKRKQALIATGGKARAMARPNGGHQHTGIGGHQTQATPALDDADRFRAAGPKVVDGLQIEGTFRAHQVPLKDPTSHAGYLAQIDEWLKSYRAKKLFDEQGRLMSELAKLTPVRTARHISLLSNSPTYARCRTSR